MYSKGTLINIDGGTERWRVTHVRRTWFGFGAVKYNATNEKTGRIWLNIPEHRVTYAK